MPDIPSSKHLDRLLLVQGGREFRCSSISYIPRGKTMMVDIEPEGSTLVPGTVSAFITAITEYPLNTLTPVDVAIGNRRISITCLRSQNGKAVTDHIRIEDPDATRIAEECGLS